MLRAGAKAVFLLAAFATFYALVCPIAPTPMAFQKHSSGQCGAAALLLNAALVIAMRPAVADPLFFVSTFRLSHSSASAGDLNCVRNC